MKKYFLGLDVGGTKIEGAILMVSDQEKGALPLPFDSSKQLQGKILVRKRTPTLRDRGYAPVMETIRDLCLEICQEVQLTINDLVGIGVGLPGTVHPKKQIMLNGNSQIFIGQDFVHDLSQLLPTPTQIICENDASCFALAEILAGAGVQYFEETKIPANQQIGVGVILGTGCGGGIIVNGKILSGKNGGGGEIGHSELYTKGHKCYCGNYGCAEQYLSGTGIENSYHSLTGKKLKGKEIFELFAKHDPEATQVLEQYQNDLAKFLANLTNIFDPDYFVLGGGVSTQEAIYLSLEEKIKKLTFIPGACPRVYKHVLGDSAGVIGAAFLLFNNN